MISALWSIDRSIGRSTKGTASRWLLKSRLGRRKHEIVVWGGHGRGHVKGEVHSKTALGRSFACLPPGHERAVDEHGLTNSTSQQLTIRVASTLAQSLFSASGAKLYNVASSSI